MVSATMQTSTIPEFLQRVDLRRIYPHLYGNPVMVHCPKHKDSGKPNLGVYPHNVYCFQPNCHWHAGVFEYISIVRGTKRKSDIIEYAKTLMVDSLSIISQEHTIEQEPLDKAIMREYVSRLKPLVAQKKWLHEKYGLTDYTIHMAGIGHTNSFPYAFTIPVFDLDGALQNIRFRADPLLMRDITHKYWGMKNRNNTTLYFPPHVLRAEGKDLAGRIDTMHQMFGWAAPLMVFLTEGEMDALALCQSDIPAISTTNGSRAFERKNLEVLEVLRGLDIMIAYDQDDAGQSSAEKVSANLTKWGYRTCIVTWDPKYGKDASELVARGLKTEQILGIFTYLTK